MRAETMNTFQCLTPESEWPSTTPVSKVHATDAQWFGICKAAVARNMFCDVSEESIFRNQFGDKILSGAMGVDKWKEIAGVIEHHLRFITISTPLNVYMRKFKAHI